MRIEPTAVSALLPLGLRLAMWAAVPLACVAVGSVAVVVAHRCNRLTTGSAHWTEIARRRFAGDRAITTIALVHFAVGAIVVALLADGDLVAGTALLRIAAIGAASYVVTRIVARRRMLALRPDQPLGEWLWGEATRLVFLLPPLLVAFATAVLLPASFAEDLGYALAVIAGGLAAMIWSMSVGSGLFGRWVGCVVPADERTRRSVDRACRRSGARVGRVWVVRSPMANAFALPGRREIGFTSRAVEIFDDDEVVAVAMHELAHFADARLVLVTQALLASLLVSVAAMAPLFASFGLAALYVPLVPIAGVAAAKRRWRRAEEAADAHAHGRAGDGEDDGVYARALEHLHRDAFLPAVLPASAAVHPHLYDRMRKAGVQPHYSRPAPPPRRLLELLLHAFAAVALLAAFLIGFAAAHQRVYDSERIAAQCLVLTGGDHRAVGALGYHWRERDPAKARVLLEFAAERSTWPEYSLRLALLLAPHDPAAAREWLQRAESNAELWEPDPKWLSDYVAAVRAAIDATGPR